MTRRTPSPVNTIYRLLWQVIEKNFIHVINKFKFLLVVKGQLLSGPEECEDDANHGQRRAHPVPHVWPHTVHRPAPKVG